MAIFDLGNLEWNLIGWRPFSWRLGRTRETGSSFEPDIGPIPITVV